MLIHGSCHCRNIVTTLLWLPAPTEIPANACTCTFCRKHGGVWTATPTGKLEVSIADPARITRYSFATATADFHVCTGCGVVPFVTSLIDDRLYAVVSVNTFNDVDPALLRHVARSFDNEDEGIRLARRQRNWIGDVVLSSRMA